MIFFERFSFLRRFFFLQGVMVCFVFWEGFFLKGFCFVC